MREGEEARAVRGAAPERRPPDTAAWVRRARAREVDWRGALGAVAAVALLLLILALFT